MGVVAEGVQASPAEIKNEIGGPIVTSCVLIAIPTSFCRIYLCQFAKENVWFAFSDGQPLERPMTAITHPNKPCIVSPNAAYRQLVGYGREIALNK